MRCPSSFVEPSEIIEHEVENSVELFLDLDCSLELWILCPGVDEAVRNKEGATDLTPLLLC
jgi:hypothetical protein